MPSWGVVNTGRPLQVKYWGVATPATPAALTPMHKYALADCAVGRRQTQPMETSYRLAVERVRANAERIRRVELPAYERLINVRANRYRILADIYDRLGQVLTASLLLPPGERGRE